MGFLVHQGAIRSAHVHVGLVVVRIQEKSTANDAHEGC